jgi:hypothetical protein
MKKSLIIVLLALVLVAPLGAKAQTVTQEEINAQLQSLINTLMTQVQSLMQQLIAMQAKQVEQGQTLSTIQTQTAPVLGAISSPAVQQPLTPGQQSLAKRAEMEKVCSSLKVSGSAKVFIDWLYSPERTQLEKDGYFQSSEFADKIVASYYNNLYYDNIQNPTLMTCRYPDAQNAGCLKVVEAQTPYINCMIGQ